MEYVWGPEQKTAYTQIQTLIASTPAVAIFDENCPTYVPTDASDVGLGAMLSQIQNGKEKVIAYASRTLSSMERNYSTGEKEALACVWVCEKWHVYLFGREFTLRTDHAALTSLLTRGSKGRKPMRISRWYSRLLNYDCKFIYVSANHNQVADALSRLPLKNDDENGDIEETKIISSITNDASLVITLEHIREHTDSNPDLSNSRNYIKKGWPHRSKVTENLIPFYSLRDELSVINGCVLRGECFVIPHDLIVIDCAPVGHPGVVHTKARLREYY